MAGEGRSQAEWEYEVLRALSASDLGRAEALATKDGDLDDHVSFGMLALADTRLRMLDIGVPELQRLVGEAEQAPAADRTRLWRWASTLLAERLVLDGDVVGFAVAHQVLATLPADELLPILDLYVRARLARAVAVSQSVVAAEAPGPPDRRWRDRALTDLLRCGFTEEATVTRGFLAGVEATSSGNDLAGDLDRLLESRHLFAADDATLWPSMLDAFITSTAFDYGDVDVALAAVDRIEHNAVPNPFTAIFPPFIRGLVELERGPDEAVPGAVAAVDAALAEVRPRYHRMAMSWQGPVAQVLADRGHPDAVRFARNAIDAPVVIPIIGQAGAVLQLRMDVLFGARPAVGEVIAQLAALAAMGWERGAARTGLRMARDLERVGAAADAATVREWAVARLPAEGLTPRERWMLGPAPGPGAPPAGDGAANAVPAARVRVRALAPALEVDVAGQPVTLGPVPAKLLVALALAHPAPLHVEAAGDLLWPGEPFPATRRRLNTVVHRLRAALDGPGTDPAPAVVRSGELLVLAPDVVDVDVHRYRQAVTGEGSGPVAALAAVTGNLCDRQFPYDDHFVDERHRFVAQWLALAHAAVAADPARLPALLPAAAALDLDPADLGAGSAGAG